jgi:hypothetical protein
MADDTAPPVQRSVRSVLTLALSADERRRSDRRSLRGSALFGDQAPDEVPLDHEEQRNLRCRAPTLPNALLLRKITPMCEPGC